MLLACDAVSKAPWPLQLYLSRWDQPQAAGCALSVRCCAGSCQCWLVAHKSVLTCSTRRGCFSCLFKQLSLAGADVPRCNSPHATAAAVRRAAGCAGRCSWRPTCPPWRSCCAPHCLRRCSATCRAWLRARRLTWPPGRRSARRAASQGRPPPGATAGLLLLLHSTWDGVWPAGRWSSAGFAHQAQQREGGCDCSACTACCAPLPTLQQLCSSAVHSASRCVAYLLMLPPLQGARVGGRGADLAGGRAGRG